MVSNRRLVRVSVAAGALAAGLVLWGGAAVHAHVSIAEPEHVAGEFTLLTFGVPHGCDGSPTTEVRIQIPEEIPSVTPTVNPGWNVDTVMDDVSPPIEGSHGEQITERVAEVVYTAKTPLPEGYRDALVLSLQVPEDAAGETMYFPTIQTCEEGETPWIEIPQAGQDAEELESPAPAIQVVAAAGETGASATTSGPGTANTTAAAEDAVDDDDGGEDGDSNGLSIAALAVGAAGLGVGGTALARQRRR